MTTIIKNGTVVTADLTYKADVRVENGVITDIGQGLKGGTELDAPAAMSCPAGSIRIRIWRCPSWAPTRRMTLSPAPGGAEWRTTMVVDFILPGRGRT